MVHSLETSAYCGARDNLPEEAIHELVRDTGKPIEDESPETWRWHGRKVRVADGSTLTMPDTPANQAAYPQQKSQKPGCGFPIARILVVFSLSVGTVLDAAISKYQGKQTGENSLFRQLYPALADGDVVLADRYFSYFSGWFDIALLQQCGVDIVVRKHQLRPADYRTGKRLGNSKSYMHLTGYNLIRGVMAAAAQQAGTCPWQIGFKGTLQTLSQFLPLLQASCTTEAWCTALLTAVAAHIAGNRPDRFEPRRVKRRPKHYLPLQKYRRLYTSQDEPNRQKSPRAIQT